jgi:hypothetical protein
MKIGILYICTGKYDIFWKDFYLSCEKYFIRDAEKEYFVFTDAPQVEFEEGNNKIHKIFQKNLGWPGNTLKRYDIFLGIKEKFLNFDYIFFLNANLLFLEEIKEAEFLPDGEKKLVACLHPGYFAKKKGEFAYERDSESSAFIPKGQGLNYFAGGINGGETKDFIIAMEIIAGNIKRDEEKGITAIWHDESHWNWYLNNNPQIVKTVSPSFLYPEGFNLPFEPKILIRGKNKYFGGLGRIRNLKEKIDLRKLKELIKRVKNKILYLFFCLYDNLVCSYFFILNFKIIKHSKDSRKISVGITSYNRDYIIHKSLKNIIIDDRISEIVILDDGSNPQSFEKTKHKIGRISNKIKLYRREKNLGVLTTKIQVVDLCENEWVILLDSDNTLNNKYIDEVFNIKNWKEKTILCPALPIPLLNFSKLSNLEIDFKKIKELLIKHTNITENLLNDGNFFFNRKFFIDLLKKYESFNPKAADIIFINYIWLSNGGNLLVLPKASYIHRIHKLSAWKESSSQSLLYFEEIRNKILLDEKENFQTISFEIPHQNITAAKINRII